MHDKGLTFIQEVYWIKTIEKWCVIINLPCENYLNKKLVRDDCTTWKIIGREWWAITRQPTIGDRVGLILQGPNTPLMDDIVRIMD